MSEVVELFPAPKRSDENPRGMWFAFDQDGKPVYAVDVSVPDAESMARSSLRFYSIGGRTRIVWLE